MEWVGENAHAFTMKRDNRAASERYQITVALPHGYEAPDLNSKYTDRRFSPGMKRPRRRYPAIFILDAEPCLLRLFEVQAQAMAFFKQQETAGGPASRGFLVVGVSHLRRAGESEPAYWRRIQDLKARDLLPTPGTAGNEHHSSAGKAAVFLDFVSSALVPHIETCYNVQPKQHTLVGSGASGAFAIFSLWRQPSLFRHYIVASPLLSWDGNYLIANEGRLRANGRPPTANLLVLTGGQESDGAKAGVKLLESLLDREEHYSGISAEFATLEGVDEHSLMPTMAGRGLAWVASCLSQAYEAQRQAKETSSPPHASQPTIQRRRQREGLPPWDPDGTIERNEESGVQPEADPGRPEDAKAKDTEGAAEDLKSSSPRPVTPEVCDGLTKSEGN